MSHKEIHCTTRPAQCEVEYGLFDRTSDVPKLIGCNVRNLQYRWDIYARYLGIVPEGANVLDFGAGSLRETYDLASRGFRVTAVDINPLSMQEYGLRYDWSKVKYQPKLFPAIPTTGSFALVTAFDVIEHLSKPEDELGTIRKVLAPNGLLFITVPNRRTLQEYITRKRGGRDLAPGEAHLQFKSRGEWHNFFKNCGFTLLDHDMAIGPLVNTTYILAHGIRKTHWHKPLAPVMELIDRSLKPVAAPLFGWNLIVLTAR